MELEIEKHSSPHKLDYTITQKNLQSLPLDKRDAVRGISLQGSNILVVYTEQDKLYGTPGGGIEPGETKEQTLQRELYEEVGANQLDIIEYIGKIEEKRKGIYQDKIFNPTMHYYLVDITDMGKQHLIQYEAEMGLKRAYLNINDVIKSNEEKLKGNHPHSMFYELQTETFKLIKDLYDL